MYEVDTQKHIILPMR